MVYIYLHILFAFVFLFSWNSLIWPLSTASTHLTMSTTYGLQHTLPPQILPTTTHNKCLNRHNRNTNRKHLNPSMQVPPPLNHQHISKRRPTKRFTPVPPSHHILYSSLCSTNSDISFPSASGFRKPKEKRTHGAHE